MQFEEEDFRVFFLNVNSDVARDVLCQVYTHKLKVNMF